MNGGINQLVDTYKGNPQPLQAKVQKAQQGQPPGEIPPDLEEAMALQKIAELRNSAQGQQAMQAGGAQQSVVDKLRQMLAGNQAQAQMAGGPPVMAARGGSIDQLMSNLGRHYAGGGIVAFSEPTEENNYSLVNDPNGEPLDPKVAREIARRIAEKTSAGQSDEEREDPNKQAKDRTGAVLAAAAGVGLPLGGSTILIEEMIRRGLTKPVWKAGTSASSALGQTAAGAAVPATALVGGTALSLKAMKDLQAMSPEQRRALAANPMLSAMSGDAGLAAAIQEASGDEPNKNKSSYFDQVGKALATIPKMAGSAGIEALKHLVSAPGYGFQSDFSDRPAKNSPAAAATPPANIRSQLNAADAARFAEKPAPKPPAPPNPTAGKPNTGGPNVNAPAAPAKPAEEVMSPMETALQKSIMGALAKDPEAVRKKAMEQNAQFMGLDALLKPAQDRASAREARIKEIQGSRQPLWIDALMSAGKPTKGGIAGVLQNMAVGAISGKQNYDAEDLKFLDELNKLNSEIDKARIEGRYKDVAAGKEAVKDLIAEQRQAEQSGTSLLNTKAVNKSREQTALDNRLSREQTAKDNAAARARSDAAQLEERRLRRQQQQQQFLAQEERKWQDTLSRNPDYKKLVDQRSMQERLLYMSTDPKTQEKAQAAVDALNDRIAKMLPTAGGGAANIPPPPPGAVRETVKKS